MCVYVVGESPHPLNYTGIKLQTPPVGLHGTLSIAYASTATKGVARPLYIYSQVTGSSLRRLAGVWQERDACTLSFAERKRHIPIAALLQFYSIFVLLNKYLTSITGLSQTGFLSLTNEACWIRVEERRAHVEAAGKYSPFTVVR